MSRRQPGASVALTPTLVNLAIPFLNLTRSRTCLAAIAERQRRAERATFFQFALAFYGNAPGRRRPRAGTVNMWDEFETWRRENPENVERSMQGGLIGSPETLRRQLQKFQNSNIDQVILLFQAGKNCHQHIRESLELFAKEVMPEFHAAESDHHEWKRKVLAGEIALEEIDTTAIKEHYGPGSVQVAPTEKNVVTA